MGWNPHGGGPFSKHIIYGPATASAGSSFTSAEVYCFGAKAVHFILRADTAAQISATNVTMFGLDSSSGLSNTYVPWQSFRNFNPTGTNCVATLGWVFSIHPCDFAGSSSNAFGRRIWGERAKIEYTVAAGANVTNLKVTGIVEWED